MRHLFSYYCLLVVLLVVSGVSMYHNVQLSNQVTQLNHLVQQVRDTQATANQNTNSQLSDLTGKVNQLTSGQGNIQSQLKDLQNKTADIDAWVH